MKLYSYNKCGTCRKAKKYLLDHNIKFEEIDITEIPPSKTELKRAIKQKGMRKLFNTSGVQYKELKIKDKIGEFSDAEAIDLLSTNGRLVKRPIAIDKNNITVGFNEDEYKSVWAD